MLIARRLLHSLRFLSRGERDTQHACAVQVPTPALLLALPDDCLLALAKQLDVESVLALSLTCRRLAQLLRSDDIWRSRTLVWAGPLCPPLEDDKRHFLRDVYSRREVPLPSACVSRYQFGGVYECSVVAACLTRAGLELKVRARGDGTLGPLQPVTASVLELRRGSATVSMQGKRLRGPKDAGTPDAVDATLLFRVKDCHWIRPNMDDSGPAVLLSFTYGIPENGGYAPCALFQVNAAFIAAHRIEHLLQPRAARW